MNLKEIQKESEKKHLADKKWERIWVRTRESQPGGSQKRGFGRTQRAQMGGQWLCRLLAHFLAVGVCFENAGGEKVKVILTYKSEERSLGRLENQKSFLNPSYS